MQFNAVDKKSFEWTKTILEIIIKAFFQYYSQKPKKEFHNFAVAFHAYFKQSFTEFFFKFIF